MKRFCVIGLCALLVAPVALAAESEAIELVTATGAIRGTLVLPAGTEPSPVVLIIPGSGPTDRDGNSALIATKNDSLKMLADGLAAAGFASVRYDKRGIAGSAAAGLAETDLRFEHYVQDAAAWLTQLSGDARFSSTAIIGHSEGALIGMLAASDTTIPYISIAGTAVDAATLIRRQLDGRLPAELAARHQEILAELEAGRMVTEVPPQLVSIYRPTVQPYLISWIRYIPAQEITRLNAPCLLIQGTTDIQVSVADAEALQQAHSACQLHIIGGMNHIMKAVPDNLQQQVASYGDPSLPIVPSLIDAVSAFLETHSAR